MRTLLLKAFLALALTLTFGQEEVIECFECRKEVQPGIPPCSPPTHTTRNCTFKKGCGRDFVGGVVKFLGCGNELHKDGCRQLEVPEFNFISCTCRKPLCNDGKVMKGRGESIFKGIGAGGLAVLVVQLLWQWQPRFQD